MACRGDASILRQAAAPPLQRFLIDQTINKLCSWCRMLGVDAVPVTVEMKGGGDSGWKKKAASGARLGPSGPLGPPGKGPGWYDGAGGGGGGGGVGGTSASRSEYQSSAGGEGMVPEAVFRRAKEEGRVFVTNRNKLLQRSGCPTNTYVVPRPKKGEVQHGARGEQYLEPILVAMLRQQGVKPVLARCLVSLCIKCPGSLHKLDAHEREAERRHNSSGGGGTVGFVGSSAAARTSRSRGTRDVDPQEPQRGEAGKAVGGAGGGGGGEGGAGGGVGGAREARGVGGADGGVVGGADAIAERTTGWMEHGNAEGSWGHKWRAPRFAAAFPDEVLSDETVDLYQCVTCGQPYWWSSAALPSRSTVIVQRLLALLDDDDNAEEKNGGKREGGGGEEETEETKGVDHITGGCGGGGGGSDGGSGDLTSSTADPREDSPSGHWASAAVAGPRGAEPRSTNRTPEFDGTIDYIFVNAAASSTSNESRQQQQQQQQQQHSVVGNGRDHVVEQGGARRGCPLVSRFVVLGDDNLCGGVSERGHESEGQPWADKEDKGAAGWREAWSYFTDDDSDGNDDGGGGGGGGDEEGVEVQSRRFVPNRRWPSDHFAVYAEVRLM